MLRRVRNCRRYYYYYYHVLDVLRCIEKMELRMYQVLQTAVELPRASSRHDTTCRVQQSLQLVSDETEDDN